MIKFKQMLPLAEGLPTPAYATSGAAGMDIASAVSFMLQPGARKVVPTGFMIEIPEGYELQCRPRSGLAANRGVTVLNSPGTIDSDYRGEVLVILHNSGQLPVTISRGDRIAQLVVAPVVRMMAVLVDELSNTDRGAGGFGSTGL